MNPLAHLTPTVRGAFTDPPRNVTFTAPCPGCGVDVEWVQGNANSSVQDFVAASPACDCEPA